MEWIAPLISGIALVLVAVIETVAAAERGQAKQEKDRMERRARVRETESHLSMEFMTATCALALVTAQRVNGSQTTSSDVEEAMEKAVKAQGEYNEFVREVAACQVGQV